MEELNKCLCCGGESLHVGATEKRDPIWWFSENAKGIFNTKGKYKLSSKLCADCGFVHWFAIGKIDELKK